MGSPLSPILANLFMENIEVKNYIPIMGKNVKWLRYVDDVLVIAPKTMDLDTKMTALNKVDMNIQFTMEMEKDGELPFLDLLIKRQGSSANFKVYRKPISKNDKIHYFSGHSDRVKSGLVIGEFLRAKRICSREFLEEEFNNIIETFLQLKYPITFILKCKKKAENIKMSGNKAREEKQHKILFVPNCDEIDQLNEGLKMTNFKLVTLTGVKTCNKIMKHSSTRTSKDENKTSIVYKIPCSGCNLAYYGETKKTLKDRMNQHRADVRHHRTSNSLVVHIEKCGKLPDWTNSTILASDLKRSERRAIESAYIQTSKNMNCREGSVKLAEMASQIIRTHNERARRMTVTG